MSNAARRLQAVPAAATPEEAAAIVAALERFMRATAAPPNACSPAEHDGWRATALLEGVARDPWPASRDSWLG